MHCIDDVIEANKGLVFAQLNKFYLLNDPEAESIAYEALYNAILNHDSSRGTRLSTLATVYIYNALGCYVRSLNTKRRLQTVSYNNLLADGSGEFVDILEATDDVEEAYINRELQQEAVRLFNASLTTITNDKHRQILTLWQNSEYTETATAIAKRVGVSQSYVSQVINNFKASLKKQLEEL